MTKRLFVMLAAVAAVGCHVGSMSWGDENVWRWNSFGENLEVRVRGKIRFNDTDTDVAWISEGGRLQIRDGGWTSGRELTAEPAVDGTPEWTYTVDGEAAEIDADAVAWRQAVIGKLVMETSLGARPRARRLLRDSGVAAVLDEISRIKSQSASEAYYEVLAEEADLAPDEAVRLVAHAAGQLSSSSRLTRTLSRVAALHPMEDSLTAALIQAADEISSSSRRRALLVEIIESRPLDADAVAELAKVVRRTGSSSNQSAVLQALWAREELAAESLQGSIEAVGAIDSSSRQQQALQVLLGRSDLGEAQLIQVCAVSRHIDSSSRRSAVLAAVAGHPACSPTVQKAVVAAAAKLGGSSDKGKVAQAILERDSLQEESLIEVIGLVPAISSSRVQRTILGRVAGRSESSDAIWTSYLKVVGELDSSSDQARLLVALLERPDISREIVEAVGETAREAISSKSRRADVLERVAAKLTD